MTTANKTMDLLGDGSDDDELPADLGPTAPVNLDYLTTSSSLSYSLADRTVPQSVPVSPRSAKKRSYNAIYAKPERPIASTTPAKPPPRRMSAFEPRAAGFSPPGSKEPRAETQKPISTPARPPDETEKAKSFAEKIEDYQQQLEAEFKKFELSLADRDRTEPLDDMDWDELEMQYRQEVGRTDAEEMRLMESIEARFQQFLLWMQVSRERESERAIKRLKTRVTFVQNSERQLLQKQDHFQKVLEAFQTAMSLLAHG